MSKSNRWTGMQPFALAAFVMACTVASASSPLTPSRAVPAAQPAPTASADRGVSAQPTRPRFVVPQGRGERLPHASAESFRLATYLPPAPLAKRAGKGVAKDAAVDAFAPPGPADLGENDDVVLT